MATDYDVAFLRLLIRQGLLEPGHAGRCLEVVDQHPDQTIAQVVARLGFVEQARLNEVVAVLDAELGPGAAAGATDDDGVAESWVESPELAVFALGEKLGRGPMGSTYAGRREGDGAPVVIKVLTRKFNGHPDLVARLLTDVRAFFGLRHAHLGETLAVGSVRDRHTVVFQRLPGPTLASEVMRRRRFPAPEAARIACQLAQGLAEVHARGLAVGDVRPSKVYLTDRGAALTDLGLARGASAAGGFGRYRLAFGHPAYLAPELRGALAPTPAGDIYALGVLLYETLCGRLPFQGTPDEMLRLHAESSIPAPPANAGVSVAFAGLLLRTTAKSPQARPDAANLARALNGLAEQKPVVAAANPWSGQAMSLGEWSTASEHELNTRSGVWSIGKIQQAAAIGASEPALPSPAQSARFTRSWGASVLMKAASLEDLDAAAPPGPGAGATTSEQTLRFEAVLPPRASGRHGKPVTESGRVSGRHARPGGDASTLRLILEEPGQLRTFDLAGDELTIGRTAENAIKIADAQSSRRHCRLRRAGGGWLLEDLESRNGTRLNGLALTGPTALSPGDRIEVGDSTVHFKEKKVAAPPEPGKPLMRLVGNLAVGERLGGGPVGTTYDGTLEGRRAAVKVVSSRFTSHAEHLAKLVERVRAAGAIDHPRVVKVLQVADYEGRTVIVSDRKPGNSLRETLAFERRLAPEEAAERVKELAQALEAGAAHGLFHGDVRPAKVLLDGAGQACLADFGLAGAAALGSGFAAAGVPFGHPAYLAPEVIQERLATPTARTDVYALGVLFYELITGQPPFRGAKVQDVLTQHFDAPVPPPPQDIEVPRPLAELLLRMLAKDPARRPASAAEVREVLERRAATATAPAAARREATPQAGLLSDAFRTTVEADEFDPRSTLVSSIEWSTLADSASDVLEPRATAPTPPSATGSRRFPAPASPSLPLPTADSAVTPIVVPAHASTRTPVPPPPTVPRAASASARSPAPSASARLPAPAASARIPAASASARIPASSAAPPGPDPRSTASGEAPVSTPPAATAGPALVPIGPEASRVKLGATWAVLGLSILGLVVLALRSCDEPPPRRDPVTPPVSRETEAPPPPATDDPARAARLGRAIDDHVRAVEDSLARGEPARALALQGELTAEVRDWPEGRERLQALQEKLRATVRAEVLRQTPEVDALLKIGELTRAELALERLRAFAEDEAAFVELAARVQLAVRARQRQLELLRPEKVVDRKVLAERLGAVNLRAWPKGVTLLDNAAVTIRYAPGDSALGDDLTYLKGRRGAQDGRGILVTATEPVLLALRVPFARVVDVQVELVLLSDPPAGGRAVVLAGLTEASQRRAHGLTWGITPVELVTGALQVVNTRGLPRLTVQRPLRLELSIGSAGQPGKSFVSGNLLEVDSRQRNEGARTVVLDEELRGWIGIYLEHVEVRIQALEVRGLLDVAALGL